MMRSYKLLGTLEIEEDGRPSPILGNSKGCALVAYLIVSGQSQAREAMADLLWDAQTTSRAWRVLGRVAAKLGKSIRPKAQEDRLYSPAACFRRSLELLEAGNVDRDRAITIWYWAQFEIGRGNNQQGQAMVQEAREIFTRLDLPQIMAQLEADVDEDVSSQSANK